MMRAVETSLKKKDWPTPQSFCRNTIVDFGERCVCPLVYSFDGCLGTERKGGSADDAGNSGNFALFGYVPDIQERSVAGGCDFPADFPSGAIQSGTNFFF